MGLRDMQGFEQMTTSGPVPATEARQNGARRHSHSFRPLHDVGGIKAASPTLPLKEPRGNAEGDDGLSLCLPLPPLIPPFPCMPSLYSPPPPGQLSVGVWRHCTLSHTLTGERGQREVDREI